MASVMIIPTEYDSHLPRCESQSMNSWVTTFRPFDARSPGCRWWSVRRGHRNGNMLSIARAEIDRHDWAAIECGCGLPASHMLGGLLEDVLTAHPSALHALEGHAFDQSFLRDPAPAVASVALGMLAGGLPSEQAGEVLWLMRVLAASEGGDEHPESSSLYARCFRVLRSGLVLVYREFLNNPRARVDGGELLEILEADQGKLAFYEERLRSVS